MSSSATSTLKSHASRERGPSWRRTRGRGDRPACDPGASARHRLHGSALLRQRDHRPSRHAHPEVCGGPDAQTQDALVATTAAVNSPVRRPSALPLVTGLTGALQIDSKRKRWICPGPSAGGRWGGGRWCALGASKYPLDLAGELIYQARPCAHQLPTGDGFTCACFCWPAAAACPTPPPPTPAQEMPGRSMQLRLAVPQAAARSFLQ